MNSKADFFFNKKSKWQEAYKALRSLLLQSELEETVKWGCPCYTSNGANVVLIHGFRDYCALLFMKGAIMKDPHNLLIQQTPTVQSARQVRFTSIDQVEEKQTVLKAYLEEAIAVEKKGLKVAKKAIGDYKVPQAFSTKLKEMPGVKAAFERLTPGRQRAYLLYFAAPKLAKTQEARVEKYLSKILEGKGIDD